MNRVVITGMSAITSLGQDWKTLHNNLLAGNNAVVVMDDWSRFEGLRTRLAAPIPDFIAPKYGRKKVRSMGRVALMATRSSELALEQAGLLNEPVIQSGDMGIAYGSSSGTPKAMEGFGQMLLNDSMDGMDANTYIKMMSHTTAVNLDVFFGIKGRVIPTSSACTSGSQGIGYAYESIKYGLQTMMLAGGAEELDATQAAVFDTLF
ncbi:MAG: beta-ketoacyl-ACP synthase, partial [Methylococcales bacterium]|nr:beta-ketoacyl-ACP synthase [Methylococcales bacterium]